MRENPELDITTFLNLMVILIPFLLISAVFSRVTILELSVPTAAGGAAMDKPNYTIEIVVRKAGLELANGVSVVAAMPKEDGEYDLEKLTEMLIRLKNDYPQKDDATVLMEPDIEYDTLIQIMDRVRETEIPDENIEEPKKLVLFPLISIGDAP
ncbi:MAG: biopolymer transporter ExbD [Deltaproteobacteria bacterium]|jgi:biopolymer transport protein ExbD|nr:biopolymer transporter ExbD [Deltaproteobacteria bacterium]MCW9049105.1 biopolymer transporter ExbD [Deltaproteobacteria bacterium]